jgi:hypothetical protein
VLDRLLATGVYDRSLVIVTADNGESFGRLGNGHEISPRNAAEIALTPLIVKLPREHSGRIVPTACPGHRRAAYDRAHRARAHPRVGRQPFRVRASRPPDPRSTPLITRSGQRLRLSYRSLTRRARASLRLKLRLFGPATSLRGYSASARGARSTGFRSPT